MSLQSSNKTKGLLIHTTPYNRGLIMEHVLRYSAARSITQGRDCLWRIASHVNLFYLSPLEDLSTEQQQQVLAWLEQEGFELSSPPLLAL